MKQKSNRRKSLGRIALACVPIAALVVVMLGGACVPPDDDTGPALEKIEAKLDRIEVKLDKPSPGPRPVPPDNSETAFVPGTPEETLSILRESARALQCTHPLGCTCFLDGIQTGCGFVLGCIDAGFCECVSGCENIG